MDLKSLITSLCGLYSVSGAESASTDGVGKILGDLFDEHVAYGVGNHVFIKRCGRKNAPKILLDAHFDEIGMLVTDITEEGFVRMTNVGGVDTRILQAAEVTVYGKEKLYGVVASTPPHLQKPEDAKNLKKIDELYIDTGYSKETLQTLVSVGTPVGFKPK